MHNDWKSCVTLLMAASIGSGICTVTIAGGGTGAWCLVLSVRLCFMGGSFLWFGDPVPTGTEKEPPLLSTQKINSFRDIRDLKVKSELWGEIGSNKTLYVTF